MSEYLYLPEKYHKLHQQCMNLIFQIEEFIIKEEYTCLKAFAIKLEKIDMSFIEDGGDIFDFLRTNGKIDEMRKCVKHQVLYAILIDFCYFMQEALLCSKKMRLVVTYSLLRRPLIDDLKILLKLIADDQFVDNFINKDGYDPTNMKDEDLRELLNISDIIRLVKTIKGTDIYELVFDKNNPNSILNLSNKALHPITNRNKVNATEKMNLNFMFANSDNNDWLWNHLYSVLRPVLMYCSELFNICVWYYNDTLSSDLLTERYKKMAKILS